MRERERVEREREREGERDRQKMENERYSGKRPDRGGTRMTSDIYYYGFYNESFSFLIPPFTARVWRALRAIIVDLSPYSLMLSKTLRQHQLCITNTKPTDRSNTIYYTFHCVRLQTHIKLHRYPAQFGLLFETRVN